MEFLSCESLQCFMSAYRWNQSVCNFIVDTKYTKYEIIFYNYILIKIKQR